MFHLAAYTASVGQTANTDIAALTDSVLTISNGHFRLTDSMQLLAAYAQSATILRARLDSPTLRLPGNPYIRPVNVGAVPISTPRILDLSSNPIALPPREEIALQLTSGLACGTEVATGLIWVSPGYVPAPPGKIQWVRITSTTAAVAAKWTNVALTFETSLPSGYWSVVGLNYQATHAIAARLIFPGMVWRPGYLGNAALGDQPMYEAFNGAFGECGRFVNDNPFQIEVLNTTTDNAHEFYVGIVQVGGL